MRVCRQRVCHNSSRPAKDRHSLRNHAAAGSLHRPGSEWETMFLYAGSGCRWWLMPVQDVASADYLGMRPHIACGRVHFCGSPSEHNIVLEL